MLTVAELREALHAAHSDQVVSFSLDADTLWKIRTVPDGMGLSSPSRSTEPARTVPSSGLHRLDCGTPTDAANAESRTAPEHRNVPAQPPTTTTSGTLS